MIIFFYAPFISLLIGWLLILALTRRIQRRSFFFDLFLAIGLGLGVSSQITFYSFLIFHQFRPGVILSANLIFLLFLIILNRRPLASLAGELIQNQRFNLKNIGIGIFFLFMFHVIYTIAGSQPWGRWDGWAVWNMKTKFLVFGGKSWADVFKLHWHTQPDYPLLLPFMNTWAFVFPQKYLNFIPAFTGMIFTVSCAGLLYAGLARYIPSKTAFLSASILLLTPAYSSFGTSQYADIVLAYYLLAGIILLTMTLRDKDRGQAILLGLVLGLMSFTKNEGIVISILLFLLTGLYLIFKKTPGRRTNLSIIPYVFLGFLLTLLPTLILKFYLAPSNRDIGFLAAGTKYQYFNRLGLSIILKQLAEKIMDVRFTWIWHLFLLMFLLQPRRYFYKETKVLSLFFILYLACVFFVYLATINFDLYWRLSRTMIRILIILLPATMFLHFYAYWRKDD